MSREPYSASYQGQQLCVFLAKENTRSTSLLLTLIDAQSIPLSSPLGKTCPLLSHLAKFIQGIRLFNCILREFWLIALSNHHFNSSPHHPWIAIRKQLFHIWFIYSLPMINFLLYLPLKQLPSMMIICFERPLIFHLQILDITYGFELANILTLFVWIILSTQMLI